METKKLDPRAQWLFVINNFLGSLFTFGIIFLVIIFNLVDEGFDADGKLIVFIILAIIAFSAVFGAIWGILSYNAYSYSINEDGFRKDYGVIARKSVTIPYDRIQNVDIYRGPIARILGLSDLQIQTAGMSMPRKGKMAGAEGRLPGLSMADAEQMRDELIAKSTDTDQGL